MKNIITIIILVTFPSYSFGQMERAIATAIPILRIDNNPQTSGMGEIGVVSTPFHNRMGMVNNPALLSKNDRKAGYQISLFRWKHFPVNNSFLGSISGKYAIDSSNAIGIHGRLYDLGKITYTDITGREIGTFHPYESFFAINFAHSFKKGFSFGTGLKYLSSSLASNQVVSGTTIKPARSIAMDIGMNYRHVWNLNSNSKVRIETGIAIQDIGPKVSYAIGTKDFIPTNLACGFLISPQIPIAEKSSFTINIGYQVEKLLVPTPSFIDGNGNGVFDYREKSALGGIVSSLYDAPDGIGEEIKELKHLMGIDLSTNIEGVALISLRAGRHNEHSSKGVSYNTIGMGIGIFGIMLDVSNIFGPSGYSYWSASAGLSMNLGAGKNTFRFVE